MKKEILIKGRFYGNYCFPSLNNYLAEVSKNPKAGNSMKQKFENIVVRCARLQLKSWKAEKPVRIHYEYGEPDKKRDVSNVVAMVKFIEDGLQKAKILKNDNPTWMVDYSHEIIYLPKGSMPYIRIVIEEVAK